MKILRRMGQWPGWPLSRRFTARAAVLLIAVLAPAAAPGRAVA